MKLIEAEVQVLLLICLPVNRQYLIRVSPDLVLGVKFSDPETDKEVSFLIKVTLNDEFHSEVIFMVLLYVVGVSETLGWPRACRALPPTRVAVWSYQWFTENLGGG